VAGAALGHPSWHCSTTCPSLRPVFRIAVLGSHLAPLHLAPSSDGLPARGYPTAVAERRRPCSPQPYGLMTKEEQVVWGRIEETDAAIAELERMLAKDPDNPDNKFIEEELAFARRVRQRARRP
jgi:hypothetical protein